MRTLILGAKDIKNTKACEWTSCLKDTPVLGDYELVIINLATLTRDILKALGDDFIKNFRNKIITALISNTIVVCLTAPDISDDSRYFYGLFPFNLSYVKEKGEMFSEKPSYKYFSKVTKWDYCFMSSFPDDDKDKEIYWYLKPFALTRHQRAVGFNVKLMRSIGYDEKSIGQISFFPQQDNINNTVCLENLIEEVLTNNNDKPDYPSFLDKVEIVGEDEILKKLNEQKNIITAASIKLKSMEEEYEEFKSKKGILAFKGEMLVESVVGVFREMEIELVGEEKYEEDKVLVIGGNSIPVEIKGHDKSAREDDLMQAVKRTNKAKIEPGCKTKAILIVNSYAGLPVEERKIDFESNIVEKAIPWNVCLLGTRTIVKYWNEFRINGKTDLQDKLLQTIGVLE